MPSGCRPSGLVHRFVDFLEAADNPRHLWKPVECPGALAAYAGPGFARAASLYLRNSSWPPAPPLSPETTPAHSSDGPGQRAPGPHAAAGRVESTSPLLSAFVRAICASSTTFWWLA